MSFLLLLDPGYADVLVVAKLTKVQCCAVAAAAAAAAGGGANGSLCAPLTLPDLTLKEAAGPSAFAGAAGSVASIS